MKDTVKPTVTAIVLTWNSADFITSCLQSLADSRYSVNILVVDNNSADNTRAVIAKQFPSICCVNTGENLGYAGGNNFGIRQILDGPTEYVFILNPDATINSDCLEILVARMEHETELAAVSPMIYKKSDGKIWYAGSAINWKNGQTPHVGYNQIDNGQFDDATYTGRLNGCAVLLRKTALKKVGLMDENYFLYYEETDWSVACLDAGYKLGFEPDAKAIHAVSSSTGGYNSPIYEYYMTRNTLYFMRKYKSHASKTFPLRFIYYHGYVLQALLRSAGFKPFRATVKYQLKGTIAYFAGRFGRQAI